MREPRVKPTSTETIEFLRIASIQQIKKAALEKPSAEGRDCQIT